MFIYLPKLKIFLLNRLLTNQDQANTFRDEMFLSSLEPFTQNSIDFLNQIYQDDEQFTVPTYDSFVALSSNTLCDRVEQDFENSIIISKAELRAQIAYDLCDYFLHDKKYKIAKQKVIECRDNLEILKKEYEERSINNKNENNFLFCTFSQEDLEGRLMALGLFDRQKIGLLYRMNESVLNNYKDMETILLQDNILMEIPLVNRRIVELDMEDEVERESQNVSKDVLVHIAALNKIRSIIDPDDLFSFNDFLAKYEKQNALSILLDHAIDHTKQTNLWEHSELIRKALYDLLLTESNLMEQTHIEKVEKSGLLNDCDLNEIEKSKQLYDVTKPIESLNCSPLGTSIDWKMSETKGELNITF